VEEHDCRAWSPNQEWVLRPLIAPTEAPPTSPIELAQADTSQLNFGVPSKVVEKYLKEQKRLREKEKKRGDVAHLAPYRINKVKKDETDDDADRERKEDSSEEEQEDSKSNSAAYRPGPIPEPPGPEVIYSRPSPLFGMGSKPHPLSSRGQRPPPGSPGSKVLSYMEGVMPIYEDAKVEDPVFPDFLLHASSNQQEDLDRPTRYKVRRTPSRIPEPTGHPDYVPPKKKYDGRVKEEAQEQDDDEDDDNAEESVEEGEEQEDEASRPQGEREESQEDDAKSPQGEESQEDEGEKPVQREVTEKEAEELEEDEDPARDVASFMKLLFKGIATKMGKEDKDEEKMVDILGDR
jgi:hypothetical protein